MKKYLLISDKMGKNIEERENIINKYDLYNLDKLKNIEYIYNNIIRKEHILAGDSMVWFGNQLKKGDDFNFLFLDFVFFYIDENGIKIYYLDLKNKKFNLLKNCELFVYRNIDREISNNLNNIMNRSSYFKIHIKGNIFFSKMGVDNNVKKDILIFNGHESIHSGGIGVLSSKYLNIKILINFIKKQKIKGFVLKFTQTCLGDGVLFFRNGIKSIKDKDKFASILEKNNGKEFIISKYIDSKDEVRIYFTNRNKFKEIFSIVKHKQKGKETHHSAGVINYELINAKKYLGKYYQKIINFIRKNKIRFGAMDILISKDGHPYVMENNSFADILAGEKYNKMVDKRIKAVEKFWKK